ncbi:MAG: LuxR family maltose regulon positive regulatory protein [Desulforhopalus sp.]|jgi:LuxR family maltose regulon positive regulatory protein
MQNVAVCDIIIRTKLHRPRVSQEHLYREDLLRRLNEFKYRQLTLVSAPAGYGKSSLVSQWLNQGNKPSSWLSLDENDNDISAFLSYVIAAIQENYPEACRETLSMVKVAHLSPVPLLTASLINEIEQIKDDFILVLDDYHHIRDRNIHQLMSELLNRPPASLNLVLICRHDPSLPIAKLRAKEQITEIRTRDLRFSLKDTKELLQRKLGVTIDHEVATKLANKTEGWVTGLCLVALKLRHTKKLDNKLEDLPLDNNHIMEYVVSEILAQQEPTMQEYILKSSILNRFCAPLCEAIFSEVKSLNVEGVNGNNFLDILRRDSIFIVALDDEGEWFRYQHLFQTVLKRQLKKIFKAEDISNLNNLASEWFSKNGFVEEAISYALEVNDQNVSISLVKKYRHHIVNREQWFPLDRWLQKLPSEYIKTDAELLLTKAWVYQRQGRYFKLFEILDVIETLLSSRDEDSRNSRILRSEVKVLRSFQFYATGQAELSETLAREALIGLPQQLNSERGFALLVLSMSLQMQGQLKQAYQIVHEAMQSEDTTHPVHKTMLLAGLCFTSWIAADAKVLEPAVSQFLKHGQDNNLPETIYIGHYFCGIMHYQKNELALAEKFLSPIARPNIVVEKAIPSIINYAQSSFALASTYHAMGRSDEAEEIVDCVIRYMLDTGNVDLLKVCQAFQADLALRSGRIAEAELWADNYTRGGLTSAYRFYTADITLPRILLAKRESEYLAKAENLLTQLYDFYAGHHNSRMLIEVLSMQALFYASQKDERKALLLLTEGLLLAETGIVIRSFLDQGVEMEHLLKKLIKQDPSLQFARQVLKSFKGQKNNMQSVLLEVADNRRSCNSSGFLATPLSRREIEVLRALAKGVSNNELANILHISPETVKRHLSTIYSKLQVRNRHQAVLIGNDLGIL